MIYIEKQPTPKQLYKLLFGDTRQLLHIAQCKRIDFVDFCDVLANKLHTIAVHYHKKYPTTYTYLYRILLHCEHYAINRY